MKMKEHITILRKEPGQDLYTRLQETALKQVQRYAGELWTDYNEHDPGVTIMDAINYILLETDYRLRFDIQDYLALPDRQWVPEENALFSPLSMFPVQPVTDMDYRKLFISSIDDLKNVWVVPEKERGLYHFLLDVHPDILENRREEILNEVRALYHTHRNLCENLGTVRFLIYDCIVLHANIELHENASVNKTMARIFFETQEFLNAGIRFKRVSELLAEGKTLDEILEGPLQRKMAIDDESIRERKTEFDLLVLHGRLRDLPGVIQVNSLAFELKNEMITEVLRIENELQIYAISFPPDESVQTVKLCKRGKEIPIHSERVNRIWNNMRAERYGYQNSDVDKTLLQPCLSGTYRNIYSHFPILNDLPSCYEKNDDLRAYLDVFDRFISGILTELQEFPKWMRTGTDLLSEKKEVWLNMLDQLYGVKSNPEYLQKTEGTQENRIRRTVFLNNVPQWGYERARGRNLTDYSSESLSGVERYMKGLFNLDKYDLDIMLIEHSLFGMGKKQNPNIFTVSVILSVNDKYLKNREFRSCCEQMLSSRIPAHIQLRIYWQDKQRLKEFDADYAFWKYLLSTPTHVGFEELAKKIKRRLADDNYWYGKV